MAKAQKSKSLAEQIAELDNPAPQDFDPEEHAEPKSGGEESGSDDGEDGPDGREHYEDVGKSKLRKPDELALGPQYKGSRVSREELLGEESDDDPFAKVENGSQDDEDGEEGADVDLDVDVDMDDEDAEIDSDDAFGESDDDKFESFTFRGSGKPRDTKGLKQNGLKSGSTNGEITDGSSVTGEEDDLEEGHSDDEDENSATSRSEDEDSEDDDQDEQDDDEDDEDEEETDPEESSTNRSALRKMMAEERAQVAATISRAAKSDAEKGVAVKTQRSTFDTLLNTRIRLQKALISANTLPTVSVSSTETDPAATPANDTPSTIRAAEEAALTLWNHLDSLRDTLSSSTSSKRTHTTAFSPATDTTPSTALWTRMQTHESLTRPTRTSTLEKWSSKVRAATAVPTSRKLHTSSQATDLGMADMLAQHLVDPDGRLVKRTKIARSCAPVQAARRSKAKQTNSNTKADGDNDNNDNNDNDIDIFDDADFYALLLKELVDNRLSANTTTTTTTISSSSSAALNPRDLKQHRPNLDTKASKGRKIRYTVHEKLRDFMAPQPDQARWDDRQRDELFSSLLGRRVALDEGSSSEDEDEGGEERNEDVGVGGAHADKLGAGGLRLFG
ncbi:MAG: hypothetical protein M1819_003330 [Sarea resinae]|nr:MAG: hypothetical protein M1819_003330 [Sarea resinae]